MKKLVIATLMAIAVLPGCGKKNDAPAATVGGIAAGTPGYGVSGGCVALSYNGGATLTFTGQLNLGSGIQSMMTVYSVGAFSAGYAGQYNRTNISGDSINIYSSGQTAYAVVTLNPNTVNAIIAGQSMYGGYTQTASVCGFYVNATVGTYSGYGFNGNISGTLAPLGQGGQYLRYSNGQVILL